MHRRDNVHALPEDVNSKVMTMKEKVGSRKFQTPGKCDKAWPTSPE